MAVLDTSFLIDLFRKDSGAVVLLQRYHTEGERLIVPPMAAAQYIAGSSNPLIAWARLSDAFELPSMGPTEVMETARLASLATQRKLRPHWADLSIAAWATLHVTHVVTANARDFERVDVPTVNHRSDRP